MSYDSKREKLPEFFKSLFWSYDFSTIDPQKNEERVIVNTINYGDWEHWQWIIKHYGKEKVKVRATIENITGYSSHKDSEHLLEFVEATSRGEVAEDGERPVLNKAEGSRSIKLKKVFVIMGEPKASLFLSQRIRDYLDIEAVYPEENREYELR